MKNLKNEPVYNWPCTRFVYDNTPGEQIGHILSEVEEIRRALEQGQSRDRIEEELADLTHSLETFWRNREDQCGTDYVTALFARVAEKNERRGYYSLVEES